MDATSAKAKLVTAYQAMYALTEPECRLTCRCPQSCCSSEYCDMAVHHAHEGWGIDLTPLLDLKGRLPLMGPTGCKALPHLRPLCTLHTCDVQGIGCKRGDPDWTTRYFALRDEIEELSWWAFSEAGS